MITKKLLQYIEAVAEELVTADPYNLQELGKILDHFAAISEEAQRTELQNVAESAQKASELIKQMILDEHSDRDKAIEFLNNTVTALQQATRPGARGNDIVLNNQKTTDSPDAGIKGTKSFRLPDYLDETIFNEFLNEQNNVLEKMEAHILQLEKEKDAETIADLRRVFHTLKGESAVFALHDIERICHMTEDLIDSTVDRLPIDLLLHVKDWLGGVFDVLKSTGELLEPDEKLLSFFNGDADQKAADVTKKNSVDQAPADAETAAAAIESPVPQKDEVQIEKTLSGDIDLLTDFVSEAQEHIDTIDNRLLTLESNPEDADLLNAVFRVFHTIKGAAGFLALDDMAGLAHTTENLLDLARKGEIILSGGRIDVVFEAVDTMKRMVANIRDAIASGSTTYAVETNLDALINTITVATSEKTGAALQQSADAGQIQTRTGLPEQETNRGEEEKNVDAETPIVLTTEKSSLSAKDSQDRAAQKKMPQGQVKIKESIKVDSEYLDKLIDAIGELVIIESMIKQDSEVENLQSARLMRNMSQMGKITRELQQLGMTLRMIPVKATFQKMARVVRDLAKKGNKKIEFVDYGEDTMLDKSVVDRIGDPLIHLVRNSVDHGIESTAEERVQAGKNATGRVELNAFHKGGNIHIEIKDDGRGLNKEAILKKAAEKGLIHEGQSLSDREIYNLIFLPGFSTASKVTDVSGRGVGMDVVKRTIEDLRGSVDIFSDPGKGSLFSIRLPLTLAIIDGMLVRIGAERYIIPTLSIVEAIRPRADDISIVVNRGEMIKVRDNVIPLFRLADLFNIPAQVTDPVDGIVIVVEDSGKMTGILVDELLGQQSTVIKSLGASFKGLSGISGGSIMSDGRVGIILDIAGIIKFATARNTLSNEKKSNDALRV